MRTTSFLLLVSLAANSAAQWSLDPAAPLAICTATNAQSALRVIDDGAGGWYCFWSDARADASHPALYGQHVDNDGYALWAANGLLIQSITDSSIFASAPVLMDDGSIIVAYAYQANSGYNGVVKALRIDGNGSPIWSAPVELAHSGSGPLGNIFYFSQLSALRSGDEVYVAWSYSPQGGNDSYAWERVSLNGDVRFGAPGHGVPNSGWGPFTIHDDLARGLIFDWRQGNGAGAPLQAMRVDSSGANVWASNLNVSVGTGGLAYAYKTISDDTGSNYSAWTASGGDIGMARYDTTGQFVWTPTPFYACTEMHGQDNPAILLNGNSLYVGWGDSRPPAANQDMYVQRFDLNGAPQWAADGLLAMQFNTYIPYADLVAGNAGSIIATFDGSSPGFCAMRILSDGSHAWPAPVPFCNNTSLLPFYENRVLRSDGAGGVVAFWKNSGAEDIYAARIYESGELGDHTGIVERGAASRLQVFPNPAQDAITIKGPDNEPIIALEVLGTDGRRVAQHGQQGSTIPLDVRKLPAGIYVVRARTSTGWAEQRFVKD